MFTVDLGEGLAERIKNSPTVGPLLEQNGVDVEGMAVYFTELMDEAEKAQTEGRPVSYTHLDVYKRQVLMMAALEDGLWQ